MASVAVADDEPAGVGHCGFQRRSRLFAEAAGWAWLKHAVLVVDRAVHGHDRVDSGLATVCL